MARSVARAFDRGAAGGAAPPRAARLRARVLVGAFASLMLIGLASVAAFADGRTIWFATVGAHLVVAAFAWRYGVEREHILEQLDATVRGLEEHRDRLVSAFESADASIISTDRELRVTALNTAGRALLAEIGAPVDEGGLLYEAVPAAELAMWREFFERVLAGETLSFEHHSDVLDRDYEIAIRPVGEGIPSGLTIFSRDVTERNATSRAIAGARREMIELSRVAGMADVATGVLHNVGNALNSAKTSAHVVEQRLAALAKPRLARLVELLPTDRADLARFVAEDPRGAHVAKFLREVAAQSKRLAEEATAEIERLDERLDHIRHIVSEQQTIAKGSRMLAEECDPRDLVRIAVEMTAGRAASSVTVEHDDEAPKIVVDRHKVIQILGNLVANARESARDAGVAEPRIAIRVVRSMLGVRIEVEDNGLGIEPDALARVFEHGFTTKSYGHGFGLHTAANQIVDLGGRVTACSDGAGKGATFALDLPLQPPKAA